MKIDTVSLAIIQRMRGISGRDLAKAAGIHPGSLSNIKRTEKARPITARALARALGVDLSEIIKKEGEKE